METSLSTGEEKRQRQEQKTKSRESVQLENRSIYQRWQRLELAGQRVVCARANNSGARPEGSHRSLSCCQLCWAGRLLISWASGCECIPLTVGAVRLDTCPDTLLNWCLNKHQGWADGCPGSDTHLPALPARGEGQSRFLGERCAAHCVGCQMWLVVRAGTDSWEECCLGCIIRSSSISSSHLKALCRGDFCSFWFRDEMHRERQVPQPAHGGAGNRRGSAVTHEGTTLTPDGCPLPLQCRGHNLLSQQRCLIHRRQTSPCLLQVIFPAILFWLQK